MVADLRAGRRRPEWHADFPRTDDVDAATLWAEGDPWGPRSIVRGQTTEALGAMTAAADAAGVRLRASVHPDNTASLRVLAKGGFTSLRGSDGEGQLVMVRPLALPKVVEQ